MFTRFISVGIMSLAPSVATAHFPWLTSDADGRALMYFSESVQETNYLLPEAMTTTDIYSLATDGTQTKLDMETVDSKEFIGRRSAAVFAGEVLELKQQYGIYHGTLLTYYAKHYRSHDPNGWRAIKPSGRLQLDVVPAWTPQGLQVAVTWQNAPLKNAQVTCRQGVQPPISMATNDEGSAQFPAAVPDSTALTVQYKVAASGDLEGKKFDSQTHYATVTFNIDKNKIAASEKNLPPIPQAVASFGAAVCNGSLYVYGGHQGKAHQHSRDNLAQQFCRISLEHPTQWEPLTMPQPLQGLALVGHGSHIFRLGGMEARNPQGADEDLHSVDAFAKFNTATHTWSKLPSLPEARSSHDAVVFNNNIYIAGGWQLSGVSPGTWLSTAWCFPLQEGIGEWQRLPDPPFQRRAIALAHWKNCLVVLGGMDENDQVSRRVDQLNLSSGQWSVLPDLPGHGMDGFGISAWNLGGNLFACGTDGILYRLADDGSRWLKSNTLQEPRFFHRLLPLNHDTLLVVAGTSLHNGHLSNIETINAENRKND